MKLVKYLWICILLITSLYGQDKKYQLTQATFEGISKAQKFLDVNNTTEAKKVLLSLENASNIRKKLDKAYIRFYIGYFYTLNDKLDKASSYFKKALTYEALAPEQTRSTYLNLLQISMSLELYQDALYYIDKLIATSQVVKPEFYVNKANIYMILANYPAVIKNIDLAISLQDKAKQDWLKMKYYSYYMLKNYAMSIKTLHVLLSMNPASKEYWLQLSSLYSITNDFSNSLASLDTSRIAKLQLNESELSRLISWLRYAEAPFKAAQILKAKINKTKIYNSEKNFTLLGDLYYEAKEYKKSIYWYTKSAHKSEDFKTYFKIAKIYLNMHEYTQAIQNIELSINSQSNKDNDKKYLYLGKAYYEINDLVSAKIAFKKALVYAKSKKMAQAWLAYID